MRDLHLIVLTDPLSEDPIEPEESARQDKIKRKRKKRGRDAAAPAPAEDRKPEAPASPDRQPEPDSAPDAAAPAAAPDLPAPPEQKPQSELPGEPAESQPEPPAPQAAEASAEEKSPLYPVKRKKKKKKPPIPKKESGADELVLRDARPEDAPALAQIYAYYVRHTAVTFDIECPDAAHFERLIRKTTQTYPFIVALLGDEIVGYAYAGPFKDRAAYFCSVEISVYVKKGRLREGIGSELYDELEFRLKESAFVNAFACIAYPNEEDRYLDKTSVEFHKALGYTICGLFENCAIKFDTWYSMVWMVKKL